MQESINMMRLSTEISEKVVEVPGSLLKEIEEELKQGYVLQREYNQVLIELTQQVNSLQEKLDHLTAQSPTADTATIKTLLDQRLAQFGDVQENYFRKHSFRILLFPEYNPAEYYKLVWGKLMGWLALIIIVFVLYQLGANWLAVDYAKAKYKQAWEQVYNAQDKVYKKEMDKILEQP